MATKTQSDWGPVFSKHYKQLIRDARKQFAEQMWGHDDDTARCKPFTHTLAVDAFIQILRDNVNNAYGVRVDSARGRRSTRRSTKRVTGFGL